VRRRSWLSRWQTALQPFTADCHAVLTYTTKSAIICCVWLCVRLLDSLQVSCYARRVADEAAATAAGVDLSVQLQNPATVGLFNQSISQSNSTKHITSCLILLNSAPGAPLCENMMSSIHSQNPRYITYILHCFQRRTEPRIKIYEFDYNTLCTICIQKGNKNSSGDTIANENFLRRYRTRTSKYQKEPIRPTFNKLDDS